MAKEISKGQIVRTALVLWLVCAVLAVIGGVAMIQAHKVVDKARGEYHENIRTN